MKNIAIIAAALFLVVSALLIYRSTQGAYTGTLQQLAERGGDYRCVFSSNNISGTVYTSGGRVRGDFVAGPVDSHMILIGGYVYTWSPVVPGGLKTPVGDGSGREAYHFTCKPWTPDEGMFTLPAVLFTDNGGFGTTFTYTNSSDNLITVSLPFPGAVVGKSFSIIGKARGMWYFEASFPYKVLDRDGNVLAEGPAQADGDWMTENFVPFKIDVTVPESYIGPATIVLHNDNPSGDPSRDASLAFPITIEY